MAVSEAIRLALKKAKKSQTELGTLWGTTPQVINNKIRLQRWTGEELAQVAAFTSGKLAIVYPDGEEIPVSGEGVKKSAKAEAGKQAKKQAAKKPVKPEAPAKPKQKKAAAKPKQPKAEKASSVLEEQISFFD